MMVDLSKTLVDVVQFFVCCFSPGGAKNNTRKIKYHAAAG
jgi:hypothetical protein